MERILKNPFLVLIFATEGTIVENSRTRFNMVDYALF